MAESFSRTAYERLPVAIKRLGKNAQTVCVHLRLRNTPEAISRETGLPPDETERLVAEVRQALVASGNYDMISDPKFVQIAGDESDSHCGVELASKEASMEDKLLADNFLAALGSSLSGLGAMERRLLFLFFERRMAAGEISSFMASVGNDKFPRKESDVLQLLEKTLRKLLDLLTRATPIGRGTLTVKGLKDVLDQTGLGDDIHAHGGFGKNAATVVKHHAVITGDIAKAGTRP